MKWGALLIVAAWQARVSVRYYLLQSVIAKQTQAIEEKNQDINKLTTEFLNQIEDQMDDFNSHPAATENEIKSIMQASRVIYKESIGTSRAVATFSFFLNTSCKSFQNFINESSSGKKPKTNGIPTKDSIYGLFYRGVSKIQDYSSKIIEIPSKISTEYQSPIKPEYKRYIKGKGIKSIPGISRGVDLNPISNMSLEFYNDVLKTYRPEEVAWAHRNFFQLIGDNQILLIYLRAYKIYFPMTLEYESGILGTQKIKLIHIQPKRELPENKKNFDLYYSNLNFNFHFMNNLNSEDSFKKVFRDYEEMAPAINFSSAINKFQFLDLETVKITVSEDTGKTAFKSASKKIEKKLYTNAGKSKIYTDFHIAISRVKKLISNQ